MWMRLLGEIVCDLAAADPATLYSADVAAQFVPVPAGAPAGLCPGYGFDGKTWTPPCVAVLPPSPPPPVPAPQVISDRQFYQQLAVMGLISQSEAIAAVGTGAIPTEMQSALSSLPAADQFAATMKLTGATTFLRTDPLVAVFAAAQSPALTPVQLDAIWTAAAAL